MHDVSWSFLRFTCICYAHAVSKQLQVSTDQATNGKSALSKWYCKSVADANSKVNVCCACSVQACESDVRERLLLERIALLQSQAAQLSEAEKAAQEQAFR